MAKKILLMFFFFFLFSIFIPKAQALSLDAVPINSAVGINEGASACAIVKVGNPSTDPPFCNDTLPGFDGLMFPANMQTHPSRAGYFKLPDSVSGSYKIYSCQNRRFGSKTLIGVLHTISEQWKQKYPNGWISIGDLNASGHKTHRWGRGVDIDATTNGKDCVADYTGTIYAGSISCRSSNYNKAATIELAKMLINTNLVRNIFYDDSSVDAEVKNYASINNLSLRKMYPIGGHSNHFHLDLEIPLLEDWMPGC